MKPRLPCLVRAEVPQDADALDEGVLLREPITDLDRAAAIDWMWSRGQAQVLDHGGRYALRLFRRGARPRAFARRLFRDHRTAASQGSADSSTGSGLARGRRDSLARTRGVVESGTKHMSYYRNIKCPERLINLDRMLVHAGRSFYAAIVDDTPVMRDYFVEADWEPITADEWQAALDAATKAEGQRQQAAAVYRDQVRYGFKVQVCGRQPDYDGYRIVIRSTAKRLFDIQGAQYDRVTGKRYAAGFYQEHIPAHDLEQLQALLGDRAKVDIVAEAKAADSDATRRTEQADAEAAGQ